jgi:hypothetical protein
MAEYMAQRIIDEVFTYDFIIKIMEPYKERIDTYLTQQDRVDLITSVQE